LFLSLTAIILEDLPPRDYQIEGALYLYELLTGKAEYKGALLCDEVGLGKTGTTINILPNTFVLYI